MSQMKSSHKTIWYMIQIGTYNSLGTNIIQIKKIIILL